MSRLNSKYIMFKNNEEELERIKEIDNLRNLARYCRGCGSDTVIVMYGEQPPFFCSTCKAKLKYKGTLPEEENTRKVFIYE